jgi:hypothetical protein
MPDHGSAAAPVFGFATFTVHDADEAALLAKRPAMIEALQRAFPGALAAWLVKQDDGSWLDVILWPGPCFGDLVDRLCCLLGFVAAAQLSATSAYAGLHENFPANRRFVALI